MDYVLVFVMHAKILYPGITLTQMLSSEQILLQYPLNKCEIIK